MYISAQLLKMERLVRDATTDNAKSPPDHLYEEIAQATFNDTDRNIIMITLFQRLNDLDHCHTVDKVQQ